MSTDTKAFWDLIDELEAAVRDVATEQTQGYSEAKWQAVRSRLVMARLGLVRWLRSAGKDSGVDPSASSPEDERLPVDESDG